jgi:hypothetical protein
MIQGPLLRGDVQKHDFDFLKIRRQLSRQHLLEFVIEDTGFGWEIIFTQRHSGNPSAISKVSRGRSLLQRSLSLLSLFFKCCPSQLTLDVPEGVNV